MVRQVEFKPFSPEGRRLEKVRQHLGISLRQFHARLTDGGYEVGYQSARRYHMGDTAPGHYFAAVAGTFGASLDFLLRGEGPVWSQGDEILDEVSTGMDPLLRGLVPGFFTIVGPIALSTLHHTVHKTLDSLPEGDGDNLLAEDVAELAARMIRMVDEPRVRLFHRNPLSFDAVELYYSLVFHAVSLVTPGHGEGMPFQQLMDALEPWAAIPDKPEREQDHGEA